MMPDRTPPSARHLTTAWEFSRTGTLACPVLVHAIVKVNRTGKSACPTKMRSRVRDFARARRADRREIHANRIRGLIGLLDAGANRRAGKIIAGKK